MNAIHLNISSDKSDRAIERFATGSMWKKMQQCGKSHVPADDVNDFARHKHIKMRMEQFQFYFIHILNVKSMVNSALSKL